MGGDDLGSFSGRFGGRRYRIEGERFIWSFLSDPSSSSKVIHNSNTISFFDHFPPFPSPSQFWGFRFTVTPVLVDDVQVSKEKVSKMKSQYSASTNDMWTKEMDEVGKEGENGEIERGERGQSEIEVINFFFFFVQELVQFVDSNCTYTGLSSYNIRFRMSLSQSFAFKLICFTFSKLSPFHSLAILFFQVPSRELSVVHTSQLRPHQRH